MSRMRKIEKRALARSVPKERVARLHRSLNGGDWGEEELQQVEHLYIQMPCLRVCLFYIETEKDVCSVLSRFLTPLTLMPLCLSLCSICPYAPYISVRFLGLCFWHTYVIERNHLKEA